MLTTQEGSQISPLVKKVVEMSMYIFPNLSTFDLKKHAAYSLPIPSSELYLSLIYAISYIIITLYIAIVVINKRNLP